MHSIAYCVFDTPIGACGMAWSGGDSAATPPAVTLLQLPEATPQQTEARLAKATGAGPASAPPSIARTIERICRHLEGDLHDFQNIAVGLAGAGPFARRVYAAARRVAAGQTTTYGALARTLRCPAAARAVGQALGRNPIAIIIPCHRVLAAGGRLGGFSAHGRGATKTRLLAIEGVSLGSPRPAY